VPLSKKDIYVVRRPYVTNGRTLVRKGTRMLGDDDRATDDERLMIRADDGIEQATAAPGERRSVSKVEDKPKSKSKSKPKSD
jgi:hypothetical protein